MTRVIRTDVPIHAVSQRVLSEDLGTSIDRSVSARVLTGNPELTMTGVLCAGCWYLMQGQAAMFAVVRALCDRSRRSGTNQTNPPEQHEGTVYAFPPPHCARSYSGNMQIVVLSSERPP